MSPNNAAPPGFQIDVPGGSATPDNPRGAAGRPPTIPRPDDYLPAREPGDPPDPSPVPVARPPNPGGAPQPPPPAPQTTAKNPPPAAPDAPPAGFNLDRVPHYETPQEVADNFDYKDSILRHAIPEPVARQIVKVAAKAYGGYEAFSDKAVDTALFFMNQHARDALMTYKPGIGDAEWDNRIAQWQAQREGTEAAHPILTKTGASLGYAGVAVGSALAADAGALPAAARVGGAAAKMGWPLVRAAVQKAWPILLGAPLAGAAYGFGRRMGEKIWGEVSK